MDKATLRSLLIEYSKGEIKTTPKGFLICCPWHEDHNPSCVVFYESATFHCFLCHGDQPKGHRGNSAYHGFIKLGMPKEHAYNLFIDKTASRVQLNTRRLPSLDDAQPDFLKGADEITKWVKPKFEQVIERKPWPKYWGFRELLDTTMEAPWFLDRFEPCLVQLRRERHPRLALAIGGAERFKNTEDESYLRQEVYLRLNSAVKVKAINTKDLNLDLSVEQPVPATLFGLVNNKLSENCQGLILVEGPYDGLHLLQHIHGSEIAGQFEVISLLGTPQFDNCLHQVEMQIIPKLKEKNIPIILAFDNDRAGFKLTKSAMEAFQNRCYLSPTLLKILNYPSEVKDPGLLDLPSFLACLKKLGFNLP